MGSVEYAQVLRAAPTSLCGSYRAIDDSRTKLLRIPASAVSSSSMPHRGGPVVVRPPPEPFVASVIYPPVSQLGDPRHLLLLPGWDFSLKWLVWAAVAVMIFIVSF